MIKRYTVKELVSLDYGTLVHVVNADGIKMNCIIGKSIVPENSEVNNRDEKLLIRLDFSSCVRMHLVISMTVEVYPGLTEESS